MNRLAATNYVKYKFFEFAFQLAIKLWLHTKLQWSLIQIINVFFCLFCFLLFC